MSDGVKTAYFKFANKAELCGYIKAYLGSNLGEESVPLESLDYLFDGEVRDFRSHNAQLRMAIKGLARSVGVDVRFEGDEAIFFREDGSLMAL